MSVKGGASETFLLQVAPSLFYLLESLFYFYLAKMRRGARRPAARSGVETSED
jgi:hypothetical protein